MIKLDKEGYIVLKTKKVLKKFKKEMLTEINYTKARDSKNKNGQNCFLVILSRVDDYGKETIYKFIETYTLEGLL